MEKCHQVLGPGEKLGTANVHLCLNQELLERLKSKLCLSTYLPIIYNFSSSIRWKII